MQNANTAPATAAPKATAPKAAPKAKATPKATAAAQAPQAPLYTYQPYTAGKNGAAGQGWPAKSASGSSIRAYCAKIAQGLAKAHPKGFTLAQYASALAQHLAASNYRKPATGFGTAAKPNGAARNHATYFAAQNYLVQVSK